MRTRVHGLSVASLSLTLISLFVLVAGAAQAQDEYGMGDPAAYLGASGLIAFDDRRDLWAWNWDDADVDGGVTVRAGIRLGAPLAIELQGDWVNLDDWDDNDNWTMTLNFRGYPTLYEPIGLKGLFPDRLQPYFVAGVGTMGGTGDDGRNYQLTGAFRLGVGGDFYVTEKMAVSFGYEWLTGTSHWSNRDTRNLILGLQYNF
jgi:hypothetical protein